MKRTVLFAAMLGVASLGWAQQTAIKMLADGHYRGAKLEFFRFLENANVKTKGVGDAEALALACDFVLQTPGTADRIEAWLENNTTSQYYATLRNIERIQLVREQRFDEALVLFFIAENEGESLTSQTIYPYPLGNLSEEATDCNRLLFRLAGDKCYAEGNYAKAVNYYALGYKTRNSLYKAGMSHFHLTNYEQAMELLTRAAGTEQDELAQNAWLHTGLSYLQMGNTKGAQMAFQQASDITEGNASVREEALYNYALTLHEGASAGFGQSVSVMERFMNDYPQSQYSDKVSGYLTEVYFTTKNYKAALESIEKISRPNAEILQAKQRVLYNLGVQDFTQGNYANALNYANQSVALGKRDAAVYQATYYLKGESEYMLGNFAAAARDLKQAQPNDNATYSLGYALFKQKKYEEALPQFEGFAKSKLAANRPKLASDVYNRIGDCQLAARDYDNAYKSYQTSIDVANAQGDYSLLQQAYIQGLRGNYEQKIWLLEQVKTAYANSEHVPDALFEQGRAYVQQGNIESAAAAFRSITERYPQSVNARKAGNELAMLLAESGKTDEAVEAYLHMLADYPNTEEAKTALTNLKDIYTSQGRLNEYMDLAGKMGKTFTDDELDEMVHEAAIKAMTDGNYKQAQEHYERLKAQTASDEIRREAQLGLLSSSYKNADFATAYSAATVVMDDASRFSPEVKSEACMYRAESLFQQNKADEAVADLQLLATDTVTVYGAQGTVRLAQHYYDTKQFDAAETVLTNFIDKGTAHTYWLARAFVLLSDVYMAQERNVEAQQTLLSLKSSYTESEEINKMVEDRLKLNN